MKNLLTIALLLFTIGAFAQPSQGKWITASDCQNNPNTWLKYSYSTTIDKVPQVATTYIAADNKYWLSINGKQVVFEGGLKSGPNPNDSYYDEIDIAQYLKKGDNTIEVLLCHYGKTSFSHKHSGKAGLLFECRTEGVNIVSNADWKCEADRAYGTCPDPKPNYRLAEASILYDARKEHGIASKAALVVGNVGDAPWNKLIKRPIPMLKISGLNKYVSTRISGDTIICKLPYNAQITPYIKLKSEGGKKLSIMTDNYTTYNGGDNGIRCEYITKDGIQEYENLTWVNGHEVYYVVPQGVKVLDVRFRESGYNTEFTGSFSCSDEFLNTLWQKSLRTLYVTMRDNYMDCPDRERAQWTGDAVNEAGEAFYALSPSAALLARKWLVDICGWQREDGVIYAPVPSQLWVDELPGQTMASLGKYGIWTYYQYTGDKSILEETYPHSKKYLTLWKKDNRGVISLREGGWNWGDWGDERDLLIIQNLWYYMTIDGMQRAAEALGYTAEATSYTKEMVALKKAINNTFWTGTCYRDPQYTGKTDDRVHALAVVANVADADKFSAIMEVFKNERHASPYMEKYVYEAMMLMGYEKEALARHKERFSKMVNDNRFTTLFEGWGIGTEGFGGGTVNHAWSGGGLTIASQYVCGIAPLSAGYERVSILPQPSGLEWAKASAHTVKGMVSSSFTDTPKKFTLNVEIPKGTSGVIGTPVEGVIEVRINGKIVWTKADKKCEGMHIKFDVTEGKHKLEAVRSI